MSKTPDEQAEEHFAACPLQSFQCSYSEVFLLHTVRYFFSTPCNRVLGAVYAALCSQGLDYVTVSCLWLSFLLGVWIVTWLGDECIMFHVIMVLAEDDVFVPSHSPLMWCFSLLLPYLWLVGMHLSLANVFADIQGIIKGMAASSLQEMPASGD